MDITQLIASGASNLWIFIPTAIFLGALHGLEPGHSKTMIAAFIIAIRGTTLQAILLGIAATVVITGVVAALSVNHLSKRWSGFNSFARNAPYFSGVLISLIGLYVFYSGLKGII